MKVVSIKDKHFKLDQTKIEKARGILNVKTETEAVEKALELVIAADTKSLHRNEILQRILARRSRVTAVRGDIAEWVREGRMERDRSYGG
jgi:hypothetical protein